MSAIQATGVWVVSQATIFDASHNTLPKPLRNETKMDACVFKWVDIFKYLVWDSFLVETCQFTTSLQLLVGYQQIALQITHACYIHRD